MGSVENVWEEKMRKMAKLTLAHVLCGCVRACVCVRILPNTHFPRIPRKNAHTRMGAALVIYSVLLRQSSVS